MDDLISRQATMDFISAIPFVENHPHLGCFIKEWISQVPAAQPEQRTGHWFDVGSLSCRCSECGGKSNRESRYCPNCGAKMETEE